MAFGGVRCRASGRRTGSKPRMATYGLNGRDAGRVSRSRDSSLIEEISDAGYSHVSAFFQGMLQLGGHILLKQPMIPVV